VGIKEKLKEQRQRTISEVGLYVTTHPNLTYKQVGMVFEVHEQWVSRAARATGEPVRRPGRKKATRSQV
jgi:hypothetical protein